MAWLLEFQSLPVDGFAVVQLAWRGRADQVLSPHLARARVTAVELNPAVIVAGRSMFGLREDDARSSVRSRTRTTRDDGADGDRRCIAGRPVRRHRAWPGARYHRVLPRLPTLKAPGVMTINLFGDH